MITIEETHRDFEVKFKYEPWIVDAIKRIPGSSYRPGKKMWKVPLSSRDALFNWAAPFLAQVTKMEPVQIGELEPLPELDIDIPLKGQMFPFQATGTACNIKRKRNIIGDEPGLGKTVQAIATAEALKLNCVLIICPNTLKENWRTEIEDKWTHRKALIMKESVKTTWPTYFKVGYVNYFIVNYESLKRFFVAEIKTVLDKKGNKEPLRLAHIVFKPTISLFDGIIIDEVHRCKDGSTQQAKFVMGLTKDKPVILALTGTAVVNKPIDLIPQLYITGYLNSIFGGYKRFVDRYCRKDTPAEYFKELNYLLNKHCMYRRLKKDVLKDLPDKMRNIVRVDINNRIEYQKAEDRFIDYLRDNLQKTDGEITVALRGEVMVQMGILKKIAAKGKIEQVLDHIQEVTDAGQKMIMFAWHVDVVRELKDAIPGAVTIVGEDSLDAREKAKHDFQKCARCGIKLENHNGADHDHVLSDTNVIILNIKSGGVGLTLTAASRVGFIELPWTPADADQCEDRCHRISQKDSVEATYFLGHNTIDEYIYKIIEEKRKVVNAVLGGGGLDVETSIIDQFINLFSKERCLN